MSGNKILFVDDDAQIRLLLGAVLQRRGYLVKTANDGIEALNAIDADRPDLVITDIRMPNLDGAGLIERLRANSHTARIPVLVLAAHEDGVAIRKAARGADDYLPKPVEMSLLLARIGDLLEQTRSNHYRQ